MVFNRSPQYSLYHNANMFLVEHRTAMFRMLRPVLIQLRSWVQGFHVIKVSGGGVGVGTELLKEECETVGT